MITATEAIQGSTPNAAKGLGTRRDRIVYWTTTGIVCAVMVFSIVNSPSSTASHFRRGLSSIWDCPTTSRRRSRWPRHWEFLRCWCRRPHQDQGVRLFRVGITLVSASIAHFATGDVRISVLFVIDSADFPGPVGRFLHVFQQAQGRLSKSTDVAPRYPSRSGRTQNSRDANYRHRLVCLPQSRKKNGGVSISPTLVRRHGEAGFRPRETARKPGFRPERETARMEVIAERGKSIEVTDTRTAAASGKGSGSDAS